MSRRKPISAADRSAALGEVFPEPLAGERAGFDPNDDGGEPDDLDTLLSELGENPQTSADVYLLVSKHNPSSTARHGFDMAGRFQAAGFDPFTLPQNYGPGRFRIQFVRRGKIFRNIERSFIVANPPAVRAPEPETGGLAGELRESREFERKLILTVLGGIVGNRATGPATPAAGMSVADMLALLQFGRDSAAPATPPPAEAIREAFALGKELAGGGGSDDDGDDMGKRGSFLERIAPRALDMIERALTTSAPVAVQPVTVARAPRSPRPMAVPPAAEPAPAQAVDPLVPLIQRYAPQILSEAKAGHDPESWGAFVGERIPDAHVQDLTRFAAASIEERQTFLAQYAPELLAYQDWLNVACSAIMDQFEPEDADEPAAAAAGETDAA